MQCSYAWFKSWLIKSEDLSSRNTSNGDVHFSDCVAEIQAASLGDVQFSLGNTAPSNSYIASLISFSTSGKFGT